MHRSLARISAVCAFIVLVTACGDDTKDRNPGDSTIAAADVSATTEEDTPVSVSVPATGASGNLRYSVQSQPAHGTLALTEGRSFVYTPERDYNGADSAVVAVSDDLRTVTARITVTVNPVNDPPSLAAGTPLSIQEDGALTLTATNIHLTDVDSPTTSLSFTVASSGTYLLNGNEVRPLPDFNGNLLVALALTDGTSSGSAILTVVVEPVNDAPVITVPAPQATAQNTAFVFDSDARITVADRDANGSPLAIALSASSGTFTLSGTNGLTFTVGDGETDSSVAFTGSLGAINAALNGLTVTPTMSFHGLITLSLTADDQGATGSGGALADNATFVVGVDGADLPPFNTLPSSVTVDEDATLAFQGANVISVADSDAVGGAIIGIAIGVVNGTARLSGTTGINGLTGNGTASLAFSGTFANVNAALNGLVFTPPANYAGAASLTLTSTSGGLTDSDTCDITVAAVNDAPDLTGPTSAINVAAGTVVSFTAANALAVSDIDAGTAQLTFTATAATGAFSFASTPVSAIETTEHRVVLTGTLANLDADLALLQFDAQGFIGSIAVTFVVNDQGNTGSGGEHTDTLDVTINESATLGANADNYKASGNVPRTVPAPGVLANDAGTGLTVTTLTATSTRGGSVVMHADGSFTYTPPTGKGAREQDGGLADSFTYTIQDQSGASASGTVNVNIRRVIWFVDKDHASSTQTGTFTQPFDSVQKAIAATLTSHFGTWIYVYRSTTPYTTDITLPEGTSLFGSRAPFSLQDADEGDAIEPTTLPGIGSPNIVPVGATAMHIGENSQISGFDIRPGAVTTGPAIEGLSLNSGVIDHVTIDDFATAIALVDTGSDALQIDNVRITDAATAAITLVTGKASGFFLTQSLIERAGRGLQITSSAGADDNARLTVRLAVTDMFAIGGAAVDIISTPGSLATTESSIRIAGCDFVDTQASGVVGTNAIAINATNGALELGIDTVEVGGFTRGIDLTIGSAQVNASLNQIDLSPAVAAAFSQYGVRVSGGTGGKLDLTGSHISASIGSAYAVVIDGAATNICLDLALSTAFGDPGDLSLAQSGAPMSLEGWNGTDPLDAYFNAAPRAYQGTVTSSGTFTPVAACAEPPAF